MFFSINFLSHYPTWPVRAARHILHHPSESCHLSCSLLRNMNCNKALARKFATDDQSFALEARGRKTRRPERPQITTQPKLSGQVTGIPRTQGFAKEESRKPLPCPRDRRGFLPTVGHDQPDLRTKESETNRSQ